MKRLPAKASMLLTLLLCVYTNCLFAQTGRSININIFGGSNAYNNSAWNNWNLPANRTSPVLRFSDGVSSGVTLVSNISLGVTDNGTGYPTTMCPPEVGRYAMLSSTTAHTLTFNNLKTDGTLYNLEIYASRKNTGNTTRFTVAGTSVDINTASNYNNAAKFNNVRPSTTGQIVITITRAAGTYAYVNGLKLTELGSPNQLPIVTAGIDQSVSLPDNSVTLAGSATDPDGSIASYQWTRLSGPSQPIIVTPNSAQTQVGNLIQGTYQFQLTVTDNNGAVASDIVAVVVNPDPSINLPPTVNAGPDQLVTLPVSIVTLSGSGADQDGTISLYKWTLLSGPNLPVIVTPNSSQTNVTNLVAGIYQFELSVTDDDGESAHDVVTVQVNPEPPNVPPVAEAGPTQNITLPLTQVTLSGSGTDSDGSIVLVEWQQVSGPAAALITAPNSLQTTVTNLILGSYSFRLLVTDDDGETSSDTVLIQVNPEPPNVAPVANAGQDQAIALPATQITVVGGGTDTDGSIISYSWEQMSGPSQTLITSPNTAQTTISGLEIGTYQFRFTVIDDDGEAGTDLLTVVVNPAPNQLPTANAGIDQTILLPVNNVTLTGSGTDPDGTIVGYSWTKIAGPSLFSIASPNSAQTAVTSLAQGTYRFELRVTDDRGGIGRDTITITVNALTYAIPRNDASASLVITAPASGASFTSTYTIAGAALKELSWSKTKVPGQVGKKVVWIGSSTVAGSGATTEDSALVWRVGNYYRAIGVMSSWLNLGVGGSNIYHGMPTGYVPKGSQSSPDITHNVTYALNQGADIVIVGYPSNAYDGPLTITEIMFAYRTIFNTVINAGKKCYIMTSQPRPAFGTAGRNMLKQVADSIMVQFPNNYIQAYYNIVQTGTHNLLYNSGDNIHLNNTGHRVLFNSVVARNIFDTWAVSEAVIESPGSTGTTVSNLSLGKHIFQVTVTDTHEQSISDTVSVTVQPEPGIIADAGADRNVFLPVNNFVLDGSASTSVVTYNWRQLTGPLILSLATPQTVTTLVTGLTVAGTYSFELSVNGGVSRDTVFIYAISGSTDKIININIFGGSNPYNNNQWNNWNLPANRTSPVLRYADGVSSGVTLVSNISLGVTDNGTGYPTTMCPPEVGRYALLSSTSTHTLTFNNLRTDGTMYNLDIYASRNNTGNITRFTVNGRAVDINTSRNFTNTAQFTNLLPNASGQIVITITRASGTYAYVNGLKLTEIPPLIVSR